MEIQSLRNIVWLALLILCNAQDLTWQPSSLQSLGTGLYPIPESQSAPSKGTAPATAGGGAGITLSSTSSPFSPATRTTSDYVPSPPNELSSGSPLAKNSTGRGNAAGTAIPPKTARPSPLKTDTSATTASALTLNPSLPTDSTSMTVIPDLVIPTTSLNPTNSEAGGYGIVLAGLLSSMSGDGDRLSAEITIPASRTAFIRSIETNEPKFQQLFDDLGGTDQSKTCRSGGGGLLGGLVNLAGCAINKMSSIKANVNVPKPDFSKIKPD